MSKEVYILENADLRPISDVRVWFKDAWQIFSKHLMLWSAFSVFAWSALFFMILLSVMVLAPVNGIGNLGNYLSVFSGYLFISLLSILVLTACQLMSDIASGNTPVLFDIFKVFKSKISKPAFVFSAAILVAITLGVLTVYLALPSDQIKSGMIKISTAMQQQNNYYQALSSVMNDADVIVSLKFYSYVYIWLLCVASLTWGCLPIMNENSQLPIGKIFLLQLFGSLKNWRVLFVSGIYIVLCYIIINVLMTLPVIGVLVWLATVLFSGIFLLSFQFSACRHLFMKW